MYFGSVKFFRHLILILFLLIFILPIFGAGVLGVKYVTTSNQLYEAEAIISNYSTAEQDKLKTEIQKIDDSVSNQVAALQPQIDASMSNQLSILQQQLDCTMCTRLTVLGQQLNASVSNKVNGLEKQVDGIVSDQITVFQQQLDEIISDQKRTEQSVQDLEVLIREYIRENDSSALDGTEK